MAGFQLVRLCDADIPPFTDYDGPNDLDRPELEAMILWLQPANFFGFEFYSFKHIWLLTFELLGTLKIASLNYCKMSRLLVLMQYGGMIAQITTACTRFQAQSGKHLHAPFRLPLARRQSGPTQNALGRQQAFEKPALRHHFLLTVASPKAMNTLVAPSAGPR